MALQERKKLTASLEKVRNSRVLCYFLSDRETFPPQIPGFSTQMGTEPSLLLADQLRALGKVQQLDLFLYTRGGATDSVWPLVRLLREHCDKLTVIVPFRAHSGGTLVCLGADEVIMTDFAELSPIDPTTGNQFNPTDPANPQNRFGISVEDVAAYFKLSEERAGITQEPHKLEILKELTEKVHPLALGNVQRVYMLIRRLARSLLALHMDEGSQAKKMDEIIEALTEKFYSHVHAITRSEATILLGDWVRQPSDKEEPVILDLFNSYAETLGLRTKFNLPEYMADETMRDLQVVGAFIESTDLSHIYTTDLKVGQRPNVPPNVQIQLPPGAPMPLGVWASRSYDYGIKKIGWRLNDEGI